MLDRPSAKAIEAIEPSPSGGKCGKSDSSEVSSGTSVVYLRAASFGGSVGLSRSSSELMRSKSSIDKPPRRFGVKSVSIIAEQPTDEANTHRSNRLT
jgi:hypothetical protein